MKYIVQVVLGHKVYDYNFDSYVEARDLFLQAMSDDLAAHIVALNDNGIAVATITDVKDAKNVVYESIDWQQEGF